MTADAVALVTAALQARLESAVGVGKVYVGPPVAEDVADRKLALFLVHVVPSPALRNEQVLVPRPGDADGPLVATDALALDLRYLLSVFRSTGAGPGGGADPDELLTLGAAVRALHERPTVDDVPGQTVRVTPEPCTVEDLSRIWGLLPQSSYRTSMVYLASPVLVTSAPPVRDDRVTERRYRAGVLPDPPGPLAERVGAL
jgi:hypothetical protein